LRFLWQFEAFPRLREDDESKDFPTSFARGKAADINLKGGPTSTADWTVKAATVGRGATSLFL